MQRLTTADWIQLASALAILGGIVLVLYELQQSREIARAQLVSERFTSIASHYDTMLGEDPGAALARACYSPEELTPAELTVLNAYFNAQFLTVRRMRVDAQTGNISDSAQWWRQWATGIFANGIFAYPTGRHWWRLAREGWSGIFPEATALADAILENLDDHYQCRTFYERWRGKAP